MNRNNNLLEECICFMSEKIFGLTLEQIRKQSGKSHEVDPEFASGPINPRDTSWEPCLRGAQKILDNPKQRKLMYRIYRGIKK